MVVEQSNIDHIMRGLQSTEGVRLHNHRKKLRQRFDIIKKLGQGTYGKVQLGINKETGQEVAIKAIKKCKIETEADLVRIRREIQIMSSVRHPNIIHIYEVFENREKMVLVMEYAAGGELYDFLSERKVLEEQEARRIFRQISTAVYYCHKHKICHRDLKLENILLDEHGNAKIADFGLSNVYDEQRLLNSFCGSPLYASPEIVKGTPYHGPEVDCWSLGVLLYTLVYGAMPFDGSNFKRLVKQISQGVYFEPKNPSSASPLIKEMLTVNPQKRATIEQICSHWWVNQGFNVSCLDIAEDLANQTPVRLDLLLSLAPPPENSEKLVVTDDQKAAPQDAPPRSLSVGSFMELDPNTEQRIRDFVAQEVPSEGAAAAAAVTSGEKTVKRKLEADASASSIKKEAARKKERTKEVETKQQDVETKQVAEESGKTAPVIAMDVDTTKAKTTEKVEEGACAKVEDEKVTESNDKTGLETTIAKDKPTRKSVKVVKKKVVKDSPAAEAEKTEKKEEVADVGATSKVKVKKKKKESEGDDTVAESSTKKPEEKEEKPTMTDAKDKEDTSKEIKRESATRKSSQDVKTSPKAEEKSITTPATPATPTEEAPQPKLAERRKSKIFETAEKFMGADPKSPEKPKKVFIPGVKVSDFAKAFERKSSLTSGIPTVKSSPSKKSVPPAERKSEERSKDSPQKSSQSETASKAATPDKSSPESELNEHKVTPITDEKLKKLKDSARNIISNALVEEERKKIKKQILKPPVPKTSSTTTATTAESEGKQRPLTLQIGKETATVHVHTPENTKFLFDTPATDEAPAAASGENKENVENGKKTSKMEITLKSNTLPRGTTTKGKAVERPGNIRTEVEQRVGDPHAAFTTQRSEVAFPVSAAQRPVRSMSLEPEGRKSDARKERIIPIQLEDNNNHKEESEERDRVRDLERPLQEGRSKMPYQRTMSQRSVSLSRQSTQDSDTEGATAVPGEAIKKSPREFIIPIAMEGGGYVTPRATSLEPSDTFTSKRGMKPFPRKISLWSDNGSEDETSPFSTLQRHPSRDLDEPFRLHRLRSTRPIRSSVDRADSASGSEEEEEDDDGFEILTAENLFSTLLSRVRSLTQRLNVEGGIRPGFPSSRLMNHFGPHERLFSNFHQPLQTRLSERPEFGRSLSRDIENGFGRWTRSDLTNSESNRSVTRDSKSKLSESDCDSIGESISGYSTLPRRGKTQRSKRAQQVTTATSSAMTPSTRLSKSPGLFADRDGDELSLSERYRKSSSRSIPVSTRSYHRQVSDSEVTGTSQKQRVHRTLSMGVRDETTESDRVRDFYDILAEKYGITNVKRYDLPRDSPKQHQQQRREEEEEEAKEEEKEVHPEVNESSPPGKVVLPPIPPKLKKEESERKPPSEKLAAVLNRLETGTKTTKTTKTKKPVEKKPDELKTVDKDKLANLSPQALDLYEKTLALYQKKRDGKPSGIPKKVDTDGKRRETPEKSVLSKYLNKLDSEVSKSDPDIKSNDEYFKDKKLKHYGSLRVKSSKNKDGSGEVERRNSLERRRRSLTDEEAKMEDRIRRLSRDLEAELSKEEQQQQQQKEQQEVGKGKREKKYVDKAIRSLRESSVGARDVTSENALIKRAVSVDDCEDEKRMNQGRFHSTVNSVLGMLKKMEGGDKPSKIPTTTTVKPKTELGRPSTISISLNRSPSSVLGFDDSSSLRSPDSESFDSWSNCSDLGSPDDLYFYHRSGRHNTGNFDEMSTESVGERIRRKSFYTRFNERRKPRRSSILDGHTRRYSDVEHDVTDKKSYNDDPRPRPFYKTSGESSETTSIRRKTSFDWPRSSATAMSFPRSSSQSSTLSRSYVDGLGLGRRVESLYRNGSNDFERSVSPNRNS